MHCPADPEPQAFSADYVFPVTGPVLRGGVVTVANGRIVAVGENVSGRPPRPLGRVALLPAFVNVHTHLEFSSLDRPLGAPGDSFPDWIRRVIAYRRERDADAPTDGPSPLKLDATRRGLAESRAAGVGAIGDIITAPWSPEPYGAADVAGTLFLELLGLAADRVAPLLAAARAHLRGEVPGWRRGLSPHAPYTVHPELLDGLIALSSESHVPLAMHLAETFDELELLAAHSGPLVEMLSAVGAWHPVLPRGLRPLHFLERLAAADRVLVVHGNYLVNDELEFLARHGDRMTVVYCPRTHAQFGHHDYPLAELLELGAAVAFGTDSRASNPDLNFARELRQVAQAHAAVSPERILRLATWDGARALGCEDEFGSLAPGKRARFVLHPLPDHDAEDPHELLFA